MGFSLTRWETVPENRGKLVIDFLWMIRTPQQSRISSSIYLIQQQYTVVIYIQQCIWEYYQYVYIEMGQEPHKLIQMGQNTSTVLPDKRIET